MWPLSRSYPLINTLIKRNQFAFVAIIFSVIYSLISLVNHYLFRTQALDLGLYTNALFDYRNLQWNDSSLFKVAEENLLADHFDLYLPLFSPFSFLFGTYTLLIFQIVAIIFGGAGVYRHIRSQTQSERLALFAAVFFYCFYGVYGGLSYDYHSNVIAASVIPWILHFYYTQNKKWLWVSLFFVLVGKENMSLWMSFLFVGLALKNWKNKVLLNQSIYALALSCAFFVVIYFFVMPQLSREESFVHFDYELLGETPKEALIFIITNPLDVLKFLFVNHQPFWPELDWIKIELHAILFLSGIGFLLWKPHYLVMLIPIYFQKLFHNHHLIWGIGLQYNIEFAPILAIGVFDVISSLNSEKTKKLLSYSSLALCILATVYSMDQPINWVNKSKIRFYQKRHYTRNYNVRKAYEQLELIPDKAKVSAQSPFVPHLALRDYLYEFPRIKDAEYIVYSKFESVHVMGKDYHSNVVDSLTSSKNWEIVVDNEITILKKLND